VAAGKHTKTEQKRRKIKVQAKPSGTILAVDSGAKTKNGGTKIKITQAQSISPRSIT
jgi:hypothetical protein